MTGWQDIDGKRYYFDDAGVMGRGLTKIGKYWYYLDPSEGYVVTGWVKINGNKYYFNTKSGKKYGRAVKGLKTIDGSKYFFSKKGVMKTGWKKINKKKYYFSPKSGAAVTGLKKIDSERYYFSDAGVMKTGWKTIGDDKYYFNPKTGKATVGLKVIGDGRYFFSKAGKMKTGWKKVKGKKYYFYTEGDDEGKAATGITKIGNKYYSFSKKGVLKTSVTSSMDIKAYDKSSDTDYLILVNRSAFTVAVYKGSKYHWTRIKTFTCTVGKEGTSTVTGTYKMGSSDGKAFKMRYFDTDSGLRCWYASRIVHGYLFHSVLYYKTSSPSSVYNGTLGARLSHGCVRLALANAKWIYDTIPAGTTAILY